MVVDVHIHEERNQAAEVDNHWEVVPPDIHGRDSTTFLNKFKRKDLNDDKWREKRKEKSRNPDSKENRVLDVI